MLDRLSRRNFLALAGAATMESTLLQPRLFFLVSLSRLFLCPDAGGGGAGQCPVSGLVADAGADGVCADGTLHRRAERVGAQSELAGVSL